MGSYGSPPPIPVAKPPPVQEQVCPESSYSHSPPGLSHTPSPLSLEELLTMSPGNNAMGGGESPSLVSDMDTLLSSSPSDVGLMDDLGMQDQGLESALRDILGETPVPSAYFNYPTPPTSSRASLTDSTNFLDGR